ncbi:MAG: trypsin-like serine protease [Candidatus Zixiibacteriota bacterium]|nr:MAG: trypsin-like serine protease [candidate division Zixibacteria bacterium]
MMKKTINHTLSKKRKSAVCCGCLIALAITILLPFSSLQAAPSLSPFKSLAYQTDSRAMGARSLEEGGPVFRDTIQIPGAIWVRLQFGDCHLGAKSYVVITSLEDGLDQHLNSKSMADYRNRSAFFNGDGVTVELYTDPEDENVFITIDTVYYGEPQEFGSGATEDGELLPKVICGSDDRTAASDPAVGRFVFFDFSSNMVAKCTAWIAASGAYLSAGHCFQRSDYGDPDLLEFNVPLSDADGSPNFADPDDQYPIDLTSFLRHENGQGDDYSVFDCNPNSDTGLLPVQGQNDFFRTAKVADLSTPTSIRITGYGIDDGTANRTLQTDAGPYITENGSGSVVSVEYQVDTMSGNSGGPVIINGTETSLGVHAHGGCDPGSGEGNHGTSFENNALESALQNFFGSNVKYVDVGHPISPGLENGTVLRPYDTVLEGVTSASSGAQIRIAAGTYSSAAGNTFTLGDDGKSMLLLAPVGSVIIGN